MADFYLRILFAIHRSPHRGIFGQKQTMSAAARGRSDARDAPNSPRKNNAEGSKPSSPVTKGSARKLHVTGSSKKRETQRELARVGWKKLVKWKGSMGGKTLLQVRSLWCFNLPQMFVLIDSNQIPQIPNQKKTKTKIQSCVIMWVVPRSFYFLPISENENLPGSPAHQPGYPRITQIHPVHFCIYEAAFKIFLVAPKEALLWHYLILRSMKTRV